MWARSMTALLLVGRGEGYEDEVVSDFTDAEDEG